jgi:Na+/melibiose symporter-like transporter
MQGIYAKYFGLTLISIAFVILIARLFDAVSDPLIGYFSDRYYSRKASRKPFVFIGGVLFVISSYFLYVPVNPESVTSATQVSVTYFLCWFILFYLAYTLFEVPHLAWGGEVANNSTEKNKIYAFRTLFIFLGHIIFFLMPLLPFFETEEFTPQTLKWSVIAVGLIMLPILFFSLKTVPNGKVVVHYSSVKKQDSLRELISSVAGNTPLLIFLSAYLLASIGFGMWYGLLFIFADSYLDIGKDLAKTYGISLALSLLALGVWYRLAHYLGKQIAWSAGMLITVFGVAGTGLLQPGESSWIGLLVCMTTIYFGLMAMNVLAPSLLADIIDYSIWKFGRGRAATYFALYALVQKAAVAIGGALSLTIAGWYGFDPTITNNDDSANIGLLLAITWLPGVFILLSIIFVSLIPINTRRHAIIRRSLDAKSSRKKTVKVQQYSVTLRDDSSLTQPV